MLNRMPYIYHLNPLHLHSSTEVQCRITSKSWAQGGSLQRACLDFVFNKGAPRFFKIQNLTFLLSFDSKQVFK